MKQIRVFIVDDDKDLATILSMALEGEGYQVELAFSGEEAIEKYQQQDFDIVFMDVKLPGMNGMECLLELRKINPETKVVMITGYSIGQLLDQAVENGAWGVLYKPLDMDKVFELIEKVRSGGILIADDDPDFVKSIKVLLEDNGETVFIANNGKEAVERVCSNGIDILILDLRMPVLNGLETYLKLKKHGHNIPVIIVSAYAAKEEKAIKTLQSLHVTGILKKPFDPNELLEIIKKLSNKE